MKKLLNMILSTSKMSLLVLFIAGGSAFAFKSDKKAQLSSYYNAGSLTVRDWKPLTRSLGSVDDPGTYKCNIANNACTAQFNSTPVPNAPIPGNAIPGKYIENN